MASMLLTEKRFRNRRVTGFRCLVSPYWLDCYPFIIIKKDLKKISITPLTLFRSSEALHISIMRLFWLKGDWVCSGECGIGYAVFYKYSSFHYLSRLKNKIKLFLSYNVNKRAYYSSKLQESHLLNKRGWKISDGEELTLEERKYSIKFHR
jgi:hypothetical protein